MANFKTFGDASTTAASNTTFDSLNIGENCNMNVLNNALRSIIAAAKGMFTFVPTSGTDIYTATLDPAPDGLATNFLYCVKFTIANTSATPSINLNSLGAANLVDAAGNALIAGALNGEHVLVYDGTNLRVLNPIKTSAPIADATNGGLSISSGTISLAPADLATKGTPTTADSIMIMDVADSNKAKTATLPQVVGAMFSSITSSLSADVLLNNTSSYFDGPSIAQGTTGTWLVMASVTVQDTSQVSTMNAKLWDGTTVIASGTVSTTGANGRAVIALSGKITSPAGNIKVSVKDSSTTAGKILFNDSGNSKDSTITAIRIA